MVNTGRLPHWAAWLDLETTGTGPDDRIIEIGMVLTHLTPGFMEALPSSRFSRVVVGESPDALVARMDPVVEAMHRGNGLIHDLQTQDQWDEAQVEAAAIDWLRSIVGGDRVALAGSGVAHFDRSFLDGWMPHLSRAFTYWSLDIGVLRRFGKVAGIDLALPVAKDHRALGDALAHVEEARAWMEVLATARNGLQRAPDPVPAPSTPADLPGPYGPFPGPTGQPVVPPGYQYVNRAKCAGCGADILWYLTTAGKRSPHDPDGTSHFATCPKAEVYRGAP